MINRILMILLITLLFGSFSVVDAFVFDAWRSGMTIDKVVAAGREKGIKVELSGGSFSLFAKQGPDELAVNIEYQAETKLMGYDAKIVFVFAPESRVLHTVRVTMVLPFSADKADMDVLADALAKQLDKKYKPMGEGAAGSLMGQIADTVRQIERSNWAGHGDSVTLESNWKMIGGDVLITYVDDKIAERAAVEDRRIRQKRLEKSSGDDRHKF